MFEAGRKNTFMERTIGQFGYEFREKVWTSLNAGGWDTVSGRSFSWTGCENSVDLSGYRYSTQYPQYWKTKISIFPFMSLI